MPPGQFPYACGVSQVSRHTRHAIPHLRFRGAKRIGPLAFEFEDLGELRPRAVVGQHTTHSDRSLVETPVSFLHGPSRAKIVGQSRGARQLAMGLEEHVDLLA